MAVKKKGECLPCELQKMLKGASTQATVVVVRSEPEKRKLREIRDRLNANPGAVTKDEVSAAVKEASELSKMTMEKENDSTKKNQVERKRIRKERWSREERKVTARERRLRRQQGKKEG